jgi:hypothetical protein
MKSYINSKFRPAQPPQVPPQAPQIPQVSARLQGHGKEFNLGELRATVNKNDSADKLSSLGKKPTGAPAKRPHPESVFDLSDLSDASEDSPKRTRTRKAHIKAAAKQTQKDKKAEIKGSKKRRQRTPSPEEDDEEEDDEEEEEEKGEMESSEHSDSEEERDDSLVEKIKIDPLYEYTLKAFARQGEECESTP